MSVIYIYGLVCPLDGGIRYIGKSIRPKERLQNHMNDRSSCHRANWLRLLKSEGMRPEIKILEELTHCDNWQDREKWWISEGKRLGWRLTNNTSGGDGVSGLPPETKEKMRKVWLGRKHKPESLLLIGEASKGRTHTEEWKKTMSEKMKTREITWGSKIAETARKLSDEDQKNILEKLSNGVKVKELAEEYNVHRTTISKVKAGKYKVK